MDIVVVFMGVHGTDFSWKGIDENEPWESHLVEEWETSVLCQTGGSL